MKSEFKVTIVSEEYAKQLTESLKQIFLNNYRQIMQDIMLFDYFKFEINDLYDKSKIQQEYDKTNITVGCEIQVTMYSMLPIYNFDFNTEPNIEDYSIILSTGPSTFMQFNEQMTEEQIEQLNVFSEDSIKLIKQEHEKQVKMIQQTVLHNKHKKIINEIEHELNNVKEPQKGNILNKLKDLL